MSDQKPFEVGEPVFWITEGDILEGVVVEVHGDLSIAMKDPEGTIWGSADGDAVDYARSRRLWTHLIARTTDEAIERLKTDAACARCILDNVERYARIMRSISAGDSSSIADYWKQQD